MWTFRSYLPVWHGKCMLPYPLTKDLPKKSVPYNETTNCGHPVRDVVSKEISNGKFQAISFPLLEAIWLTKFFYPATLIQSAPLTIVQKAVSASSSGKKPVRSMPVNVT